MIQTAVFHHVLSLFFCAFSAVGWKAELLRFLQWMETTFPPPTAMTSGVSRAQTI